MTDKIPKGSRWNRGSDPNIIRVMGTVEGWVVARNKGCAPFLLHENDWTKRYQPAPLAPRTPNGSAG